MSEELIDAYVDRTAVADDTKFITGELKSVLDLFDKVNAKKINLGGAKGMKDITTSAKELKSVLDSLQKTTEAYTKTQIQEAKLKKENANAAKAEAQARKENAAAAQKEQQASDSAAKSKANEQKVIDQIANEYQQLSKAYNDAALKAKNYALLLGENHPVTVQAVKDAKAMHDILLRVDQSVGQSQRNVGNYKSAFDGLSVSVTQVARELPSLAISAQQFVLAISNNLPMVFDELKKAKEEIAALKAQGKDAPSIFQRLGSAILSWQVGLSVGIALLTAYSGKIIEWVGNLFDSGAALRQAAQKQHELNQVQEKGLDILRQYNTTVQDSRLNVNKTLEDEIAFAKARGDSTEKVLKMEKELLLQRQKTATKNFFDTGGTGKLLELEIQLTKTEKEYQKFLETGEAFGKSLTFGSDAFKERESQLSTLFSLQSKKVEDQKKIVDDYFNTERDLQAKDLEIKKTAEEQWSKFFADELQYRADILKKFSEIEESPEITRVNARKQAVLLERAIIKGQHDDELREAKDNQVKIFEANRDYTFKKKKLQEDYDRDLLTIRQTSIKRQREIEEQDNQLFYDEQERLLHEKEEQERKKFETSKNYLEEERDIFIKIYAEERNEKIKSAQGDKERQRIEEEYNNKRLKKEIDTNISIIESALDVAKAKLKIAEQPGSGADESQISSLKASIASLKKELATLKGVKIDLDTKSAKEKLEKLKSDLQEYGGKAIEVFNQIGNLIGANIDRQKNAIQDQIDDIERKKEKEIDAINASARTEQEKAAAIAIINSKAAARKEELERKQRQLDLQRARFDKAKAIADIALKTAVAVVQGLIQGGPILAAIYGAIGAAELAIAIAQPLPKFKHGREDGPATWGVTGDGGKHEVVTSPDLSQGFVTPATDTLTYLPKNWKVFPDIDAFQEAAVNMAHKPLPALPIINNNNYDGLIHAMAYEIGGLKRAIMGKQENYISISDGEWKKAIKNGNDWLRYIQGNI